MPPKSRTKIEYEIKVKERKPRIEKNDPLRDTPTPIPSLEKPPVRSFIHDIISSDTVPKASVLLNREKITNKPRGLYIEVPVRDKSEVLPLDVEWFSAAAYPEILHRYLVNSYTMNFIPSRNFIDDTSHFLADAYYHLHHVNLNLNFGSLKSVFDDTIKHRINESPEIRNRYLLMAYGMSKLLFDKDATVPTRKYTYMSYPAVIAASYINRAVGAYQIILDKLKIDVFLDYLEIGKRRCFDNIPSLTTKLIASAAIVSGRDTPKRLDEFYYNILQNIVLNLPSIDEETKRTRVRLDFAADKVEFRIKYYLDLITSYIRAL